MSESSPDNPFASPQAPTFEIDAALDLPDPPGDGPFYFDDVWVGGRTPLTLSGECLACGQEAADNQRRVKTYRHRDRMRYPRGCKISYSVCSKCGFWIDFWRRCARVSFALFCLAVIVGVAGGAEFYFHKMIDPNNLIFLGFLIGSILSIGGTFLAAGISDSLQPLRLAAIKDEGNRTYIAVPNQQYQRAVAASRAKRQRAAGSIE